MNNTTDWAAIAQKLHQDCRALESKLAEVTKQRDKLVKSIRSFQTDFEAIRWGYDGDCGSARLADILFWNLIAAVKGGEG